MLDQVFRWASVAADIAQVVAIYFLIRQINVGNRQTKLAQSSLEVGVDQMRLAQATLEETRTERKRQAERQGESIRAALRAEVDAVQTAADLDIQLFNPSDLSDTRVADALRAKQGEGDTGYHRSFVWTALPIGTVEQAIREADLLALGP